MGNLGLGFPYQLMNKEGQTAAEALWILSINLKKHNLSDGPMVNKQATYMHACIHTLALF